MPASRAATSPTNARPGWSSSDPAHPHAARDRRERGPEGAAAQILESRGSSPRNYKNTLVFLAADANRLRELEQAVRQYLAWTSIWNDRVTLNLDQFQARQAETKRKTADETVDARIPETYQWLIVPGQPDPQGKPDWTEYPAPRPGVPGDPGRQEAQERGASPRAARRQPPAA